MELVERGEIAATVHEPVRAESLAHLGGLAGVEQADGWVFSRAWLDELRAELDERLDRGRPARPRRRAAAGAVGGRGRCRCSASSGAARSSTGRARPPSSARARSAAAALEAQLGLEPVKVDDAALARFLEEQGRLVRVGDGYAISAAAYEQARAALVAELEKRRPDHARTLPRPARRRPQDGAAAARALRRRRAHAACRRRARAAPAWDNRAMNVIRADRALQRRVERAGPRRDPRAAPSRDRLRQPHGGRARGGRRRRARAHRAASSKQPDDALHDAQPAGRRGLRRVRMDAQRREGRTQRSSGTASTSSRSGTG